MKIPKAAAPYVGVTGFMSPDEVREVLTVVPEGSKVKLMVGVLASSETIKGHPPVRWPNRYAKPERISEIFINHPAVLNLVHFYTKEPEKLLDQMVEVTKLAGKNFHGFQLNVRWPNPAVIREYRQQYPDKVIVLQCGSGALKEVENDPTKLGIKINDEYKDVCKYVLVDPSGGAGKPLDANFMFNCLRELHYRINQLATADCEGKLLNFVLAGGLNAEAFDDPRFIDSGLWPAVRQFWQDSTSVDAEGKLRDENDNLVVIKAKAYVARGLELLEGYE